MTKVSHPERGFQLSERDAATLQREGDRALRMVYSTMPPDQRADHVQDAIVEALEAFPTGPLEEWIAEVRRRVASIAGTDVKRAMRQAELLATNEPFACRPELRGEALRQAVRERALLELADRTGLTVDGVREVIPAKETDWEAESRFEREAWHAYIDLALALGQAVIVCHNAARRVGDDAWPQLDRLRKVVRELCGEVSINDLMGIPCGNGMEEIVHDPTGALHAHALGPAADCIHDLLEYRLGHDPVEVPSAEDDWTPRERAFMVWLDLAVSETVRLRTGRDFALASLLSGNWPTVEEPATVEEVIGIETDTLKKIRSRLGLTSNVLKEQGVFDDD